MSSNVQLSRHTVSTSSGSVSGATSKVWRESSVEQNEVHKTEYKTA